MTTSTWSSNSSHTSDADFRAWGKELSDRLQAMSGLTKTLDTGQVNWLTATRPAINTYLTHYEIYYLNDSLHSTAPIYIKIYYGTGSVVTNPRMTFNIGTGTNGLGALTGLGIAADQNFTTVATGGSATATPSYLCVTSGFLGLFWKMGVHSSYLIIQRTCDPDGTPNGKGALLLFRTATTFSSAAMRYEATATAYAVEAGGMIGFIPQSKTDSSLQGGDKQVFLHWGMFPDMRPMFGTLAYVTSEIAPATTFSAAMVGSTPHTYLAPSISVYGNGHSASYAIAMLWE